MNGRLSTGIFALALAFVVAPRLSSQKNVARDVMEKMSQTYRQWGGISVTFAAAIRPETDNESGGAAESFEGAIVMKGDKFILTTPDMTTWFDGVTQWSYVARNEEVNIITPSRTDLRFLNPMLLIRDCDKDFKMEYIGESTAHNAKTACDIALVPKKQEDVLRIEIQIEKATYLPARLVVIMRNHIRNTVTIKKIEQTDVSDTQFSFPPEQYPEAEIIDLR